jgi:hypothetical protein
LYTGAGAGSSTMTGGGAFPFPLPIVPQPLRLLTASAATTAIRILLIKCSPRANRFKVQYANLTGDYTAASGWNLTLGARA